MKHIQLTQGKSAIVDDERYYELSKYKWCFDASIGYAVSRIGGKNERMHRFILKPPTRFLCDHMNGDKLDNRINNLRLSLKSSNGQNRGKQVNNTSGYKGVSWNAKRREYDVRLTSNNKSIFVGWFKDIKQAAKAYNQAAIKHHGEFAKLNAI